MNIQEEIWRPVMEFPEYFLVSNHGRVKSVDRVKNCKSKGLRWMYGRILSQKNDKDGYKYLGLRVEGKRYWRRVHVLVAQAFIENLNKYPVVNHLDTNVSNNHAWNLEWCTISRNTKYAYECGRIPNGVKAVFQCDLDGNILKRYERVEYTKHDGFAPKNVSKVLVGEKKTHKGFKWVYA